MKGALKRLGVTLITAACCSVAPWAAAPAQSLGYCRALGRAVDEAGPGNGPAFVASYQPGPDESSVPEALRTSAFSYDNALASIALLSCGDRSRALRIADAFVIATAYDRTFDDGRIRNAYRAGAATPAPAKLPGWWDAGANRWDEDAYQDGSSTGNVAWVALAMLNAHAATDDSKYLTTASRLLAWIDAHTVEAPGPPGFSGGVSGFDGRQIWSTWKSTEHNIDVAAAAAWAHRLTGDPADLRMAERARAFVASRFRPGRGFFLLGTKPDGSDADADHFSLDVQVWPILAFSDPPPAWRGSLAFANAHLRNGDGMTFAGLGSNRWTEGEAQAALAFRAAGDDAVADELLMGLPAQASPSGLLFATSAGEVPTGLQVEAPGGGDFNYFHRPHLGATAWAALAATGWNPFTGRKVD